MCGLIGSRIWIKSRFEAVREITQETLNTLTHRGPDAMGIIFKEQYGLTLGHTRLSIFDPSPTGNQPMASQSGHGQLVYNGAIYNYVELKKDLEAKGISFRGTSDTEVLIECLSMYGTEALQKLRGMFAFAFWNEKDKTLLLARDRVGKKPLYYSHTNEGIYFASEINTLAAYVPESLLEINPAALNDYLSWGYIGGENTIYKGIHCLPPGCFLVLDSENKLNIKTYWQAQWETTESINPKSILQTTEELLQEAVKIRLRADVPVGVLLSGGIDSGLITAMAAKASSKPISTFCVGSENSDFDERTPAREIAKLYKTDHHEIIIKPDVSGLFEKILFSYGQPFADPSAIPSYFVSEFASRTVKVVLNGDGGDELFCGYRRHIVARLLKYLSREAGLISSSKLAGLLLKLFPYPKKHRTGFSFFYRLLRILSAEGIQRHLILSTDGFNGEEKGSIYKEPEKFLNTPGFMEKKLNSLGTLKNLDLLLAADFESELPYDLLVKMDIATMSHGLEARSPFLDSKLVSFSQRLHSDNKIEGLQTKPILRKIARNYLPPEILNLPKRGFEIPVKGWLQGELKEHCHDLLLNRSGIVAEIFKRDEVEALLKDQKTINKKHSRWAQLIWNLFVLSGWDQKRREHRQSVNI